MFAPLFPALAATAAPGGGGAAGGASDSSPVAVVGMGCAFPAGAASPAEFWSGLLEPGVDAVIETPPGRWSADFYVEGGSAAPGKMGKR